MNLKAQEQRYKLLCIPYHLVLSLVEISIRSRADSSEGCIVYESLNKVLQQLPDGTQVHDCYKSDGQHELVFKLWHESFNIVERSEEISEIQWENYDREIRNELTKQGYYPPVADHLNKELPDVAPYSTIFEEEESFERI